MPANFTVFSKETKIEEAVKLFNTDEMLHELANDQVLLVKMAQDLSLLTEKAHDSATSDLLARRILAHDKNAWMLKSSFG